MHRKFPLHDQSINWMLQLLYYHQVSTLSQLEGVLSGAPRQNIFGWAAFMRKWDGLQRDATWYLFFPPPTLFLFLLQRFHRLHFYCHHTSQLWRRVENFQPAQSASISTHTTTIVAKKWEPGNLVPSPFSGQIRKVEARLGKLAKIRKVETN